MPFEKAGDAEILSAKSFSDSISTFSDALLYHLVQDAKLLSWNSHEEHSGEPLILHFGEVYFEF